MKMLEVLKKVFKISLKAAMVFVIIIEEIEAIFDTPEPPPKSPEQVEDAIFDGDWNMF